MFKNNDLQEKLNTKTDFGIFGETFIYCLKTMTYITKKKLTKFGNFGIGETIPKKRGQRVAPKFTYYRHDGRYVPCEYGC